MNEIKIRRHGDVNLLPISEAEYRAITGEIIKHDGEHILARGEATGSVHKLKVKNPYNLEIKKDIAGNMYFAISEIAEITHTSDHDTITTPKKVWYKQIQEREKDWFSEGIVRRVVD